MHLSKSIDSDCPAKADLGSKILFHKHFNSLLYDKILDWSKLKAFADDKMNVAQVMIPIFDRVENIVRKGENAGYQHFLLFPQCFLKASLFGS